MTGTNTFSNGSVDFTGNYTCTNNTMIFSGGVANFDGTGVVAPAVLNLNGFLGGSSVVTVTGAMNWTAGSMSGSGRTVIPAGVTLNIANPTVINLISRTLDNSGTVLWTGGTMGVNSAVITNEPGALFQIQNPATFSYGGGSPRFDNAGTLRISGAGTTFFASVSFNNYNDTQIQSGTLQLGGGLNNGTMEVPIGTTINFSGAFTSSAGSFVTGAGALIVSGGASTLAGTVNVTGTNTFSNGSVDFTGNYTCTNNTMIFSGGVANFDGTGVVAPAVLNLNGFLGGSSVVTVTGAMNWTAGSMSGSGRTVIPAGATLTISNPSFMAINNRTLDNGGTTLWTGAGIINLNAAVITNRVGALFNVQNASSFNFGGGAPRFDNAGIFRKSAGIGTATIGGSVPFTNYGTVDIQSGFLAANGGYASSSNAVLNCAISGTKPGTNYGQLQVSGSVTLNGTLSVNVTNNYIPTTNDSFTVLTAGTRNGTFASFTYPSNNLSMLLTNTPTSEIVKVTAVSLKQTNSVPAPAGMISWWRAENNATDSIGTNNGTISNGVSFAAGEVGQSFLFDGTSGYVSIPDSASLRPVSVTVEAWVKIFSTNAIQLVFAKPLGAATLDSYGLALQNGVPLAAICDNSGFGVFLSDTAVLTLGLWHHMAFTFDATIGFEALYTDGAMVASANAGKSMNFDNHPLLLGGDNDNTVPDNFLNGQIDEASIYNRALTLDEIASIFNAGPGGKQIVSTVSLPVLYIQAVTPATARLFWSTNFPTYHLEYNAALGNTNWAALGATPVVVGTNYVVTNAISGTFQFYRLSNH